MIRDLLVNGCSFTQTPQDRPSWSVYLHQDLLGLNPDHRYHNLALSGTGNNYIADSTVRYLLQNDLDPQTTLVMIMWTGVTRIDINVSQEYHDDILSDTPNRADLLDNCWAMSTGMGGAWTTVPRAMFENIYKAQDNRAMAGNTLLQMVNLRHFLEARGYRYRFMSYVNYWGTDPEWYSPNLDFSIGHYASQSPLLKGLGDHWIWVNDHRDCLFEFAQDKNMLLDDGFHPDAQAHELFYQQVVKPNIERIMR